LQRRSFLKCAGMAMASPFVTSVSSFSRASAAKPAKHRLPLADSHYQGVRSYIEDEPVPEYRWASDTAYEAFRDMKYGVRIHWGLYSVAGFTHESWPFLELSFKERARYNEMYRTWNPTGFDADGHRSSQRTAYACSRSPPSIMRASRCSIRGRG
jgi:alpha-L-fucosidase